MQRRFVVAALAALPVALWASGALADQSPVPPAPIEAKEVTITLSGAKCPDLPKDVVVTGTGSSRTYDNTSTDASGVTHLNTTTVVSGNATDNKGGKYWFDYQNTLVASFTTLPFVGVTTDHFDLVRKRVGGGVHTFFVANLTVTGEGPNDFQIQPLQVRGFPIDFTTGEAQCDPL